MVIIYITPPFPTSRYTTTSCCTSHSRPHFNYTYIAPPHLTTLHFTSHNSAPCLTASNITQQKCYTTYFACHSAPPNHHSCTLHHTFHIMPPGIISHQHISCCTTTSSRATFHSRPPHFAGHLSFCITLTVPHLTLQKCTSHFISQTIPHHIATYSCTSQLHSTSRHPATSDHVQHHNYTPCRYPFHPCVAAVARKRSRSFCQKCRWQVTAKHIDLAYVALHEVTWNTGLASRRLQRVCRE